MCIVFISFYPVKECPLVILNNRDEICERPTIPLKEFKLKSGEIEPLRNIGYNYNSNSSSGSISDNDRYYSKDEDIRIYCGKDKVGGGTWLGVNNKGKFCTILNLYNKNFHDSSAGSGKLSRGKIVQNYLSSKISPFDYILLMEKDRQRYHPFILIAGDIINSSEKYYCFLSHLLPPKEMYDNKLPVNSYPSLLKVIERNSVFAISNYPLEWNINKVSKGQFLLDSTLKSILKEKNLFKDNQNNQPHCCNNQEQKEEEEHGIKYQHHQDCLFTSSEELKLLNILYNDDKDSSPPASTEHINTSSIFVHPYHSKISTKVHSTVASSLITFSKLPTSKSILMNFTQVDNINNKTFKINNQINT